MKVTSTALPGVVIIEPQVFGDSRGFFKETFQQRRYREEAGIEESFVQDNLSRSSGGVIRGLHFQVSRPQGKLVACPRGRVLDVAVDIRPGSPTLGQHVAVELSEENHLQLWVPPGYAHGFAVLSETAEFAYKCSDYYDPSDEAGIRWDDPEIGIDWQVEAPRLSEKDQNWPTLAEYLEGLQP